VCKYLGYSSKLVATFGGSDNNNFVRNNITGIVLACGMQQVHSCEEYTYVEDLEKCSRIVMALMTS
jgi:tripeptide aminopeptidase